MAATEKTNGLPVTARGGSMEIRRNDRIVVLTGAAECAGGGAARRARAIRGEDFD